jgi:hypothetical protein
LATAEVIRDVGDTLIYALRAGVDPAIVAPSNIRVATPDEFDTFDALTEPSISLFLHRIAVSATVRNSPRRVLPDGTTTRPLLPLEACWLITPWAPNTSDEHLVAGQVMQALYDRAELGPTELQGSSWAPGDTLQIVLESLPMEDHYRIWETSEIPYRLSLTYVTRVVGLEPKERVASAPIITARFGGPNP